MMTVTMSGSLPREIPSATVTKTVRAVFSKVRRAGKGSVGVRFVGEKEMAALNRRYRGKNRPTDVLSFTVSPMMPGSPPKAAHSGGPARMPAVRAFGGEFGDIVVASAFARREAKRRGIPFSEEIIRLVAHGTLHLLGYDHATAAQESRMFRLQEAVVDRITSRP